jgi:hypothetical protein
MEYAATHGLAVFTHESRFRRAAGISKCPASVIQIRTPDVLPSAIGEVVLRALRTSSSQLEAAALVTVDPKRARIRLLPIQKLPRQPRQFCEGVFSIRSTTSISIGIFFGSTFSPSCA